MLGFLFESIALSASVQGHSHWCQDQWQLGTKDVCFFSPWLTFEWVGAGTCLIWKGLGTVLKISFSPSVFSLIWFRWTFLLAVSSLRWILTHSLIVGVYINSIMLSARYETCCTKYLTQEWKDATVYGAALTPCVATKSFQEDVEPSSIVYLFPQALMSDNSLLSHEQILHVLWHLLTECSLLLLTSHAYISEPYLPLSQCVTISLCYCVEFICSHTVVNWSANVKCWHPHGCHTLNNEKNHTAQDDACLFGAVLLLLLMCDISWGGNHWEKQEHCMFY